MEKPTKILVGIATVWPFVYMLLFMLFMSSAFLFLGNPGGGEPPLPFFLIFPLHLFTMLAIMALTVFYIVNVFRNERVEKDKKVLWAVVLFMGSMIAMPIYWYLYIWKEPDVKSAPLPLNSADTSSWVNNADASQKQAEYVPPSEMPNWRS